ncbi:hypothetical protein ACKLKK_25780, partial [Salmonella enterica subsp. enterica serovar Dublin]
RDDASTVMCSFIMVPFIKNNARSKPLPCPQAMLACAVDGLMIRTRLAILSQRAKQHGGTGVISTDLR